MEATSQGAEDTGGELGASPAESALSVRPKKLGLIAGWGRFPFLVARAARESHGLSVVCVAIRGEASRSLRAEVDELHWCGVAKVGRMIRILKGAGVKHVVWAGKIHKVAMHKPWRLLRYLPDLLGYRIFYKMLRDKKDDTILGAVLRAFASHGLEVRSQTEYCPRILAPEGAITAGKLTEEERRDVSFGWQLAKEMGRLDVGQSVMVKESSVLAVEAIEGTDSCILRAGELCPKGGFTMVKVAKPKQDMRFDMPAIGPTTVRRLAQAGGSVLAVEAGKTLVIEAESTVEIAERLGIRVVGITGEWTKERSLDEL